MRVLLVSTFFPEDLRTNVSGTFQRMRLFIDAVKEMANLDMFFYVRPGTDTSASVVSQLEASFAQSWKADIRLFLCPKFEYGEQASKWQLYGAGALSFLKQPGFVTTSGPLQLKAFENCLDRKPDLIFVHRLSAMCPVLMSRKSLPPVFFDLDDIEHVSLLRRIDRQWRWRQKLVYYSRIPALCWGERRAIRLARLTFVCSEMDRRYLEKTGKLSGVVTVPNTTEATTLLPVSSEPTLLFLGSYRYWPNVQAAEFLIEQIWPHIRQSMPEARLILAGASPENIRGFSLARPGVEFTGFVDDLEALYRRTRLACVPILSGSGTRIKIIEAASYGKPVVATRIGAEGLEMKDGRELLLRDNPESFAQACLKLLKDLDYCRRLGSQAYEAAVRHYRRDKIVRLIQSYLHCTDGRPRNLRRSSSQNK